MPRNCRKKLAALPGWRDPGDIETLRSYARARAEETALLQYTTHGLNRLFKPANPSFQAFATSE